MGTITERLVLRKPTSAKANSCAAGETERLTLRVANFKIAFDLDRTVAVNCNFRGWHTVLRLTRGYYFGGFVSFSTSPNVILVSAPNRL